MLQEKARTCGALDRASPCHLLILRNANLACLWHLFMSHVEFKKKLRRMSIGKPCFMPMDPMLHVKFKNRTCCSVNLRGQGPYMCLFL